MSFKYTIPYFLTGAAMVFGAGHLIGANGNSGPNDKKSACVKTAVHAPENNINSAANSNADYTYTDNATLMETPIEATAQRYDVVYTRANGNQFKRSGGTRAWRNNNPGCLRYSEFAVAHGAIGRAGGFAVFPDEETGRRAIAALLRSDGYSNLTIAQAIFKYAPPHENDTQEYKNHVRKSTELPIDTKISALNDEQIMRVVKIICIVEGWRPGHETNIKTDATDSVKTYNQFSAVQAKIMTANQYTR